jgi:hypothetical protein
MILKDNNFLKKCIFTDIFALVYSPKNFVRWILEGDSNTNFFHQYANGRRRRNTIVALETDQGEMS